MKLAFWFEAKTFLTNQKRISSELEIFFRQLDCMQTRKHWSIFASLNNYYCFPSSIVQNRNWFQGKKVLVKGTLELRPQLTPLKWCVTPLLIFFIIMRCVSQRTKLE